MKGEAQLIALLEWMGWTHCTQANDSNREWFFPPGRNHDYEVARTGEELPPLTLDLMHEAVMKLPDNSRDLFNLKLCDITAGHFDYSDAHDLDAAINASKEQRLEALLETIGKTAPKPPPLSKV